MFELTRSNLIECLVSSRLFSASNLEPKKYSSHLLNSLLQQSCSCRCASCTVYKLIVWLSFVQFLKIFIVLLLTQCSNPLALCSRCPRQFIIQPRSAPCRGTTRRTPGCLDRVRSTTATLTTTSPAAPAVWTTSSLRSVHRHPLHLHLAISDT